MIYHSLLIWFDAQSRSLIRAFASRSNIQWVLSYNIDSTSLGILSFKGGCKGSSESTLVKMSHCWKSHVNLFVSLSLFLYLILTVHGLVCECGISSSYSPVFSNKISCLVWFTYLRTIWAASKPIQSGCIVFLTLWLYVLRRIWQCIKYLRY